MNEPNVTNLMKASRDTTGMKVRPMKSVRPFDSVEFERRYARIVEHVLFGRRQRERPCRNVKK
jgi:hypothetical protein